MLKSRHNLCIWIFRHISFSTILLEKVLKNYIFISKESRERHLNSTEFKQGQLRITVERTEMPVQGKDLAVLIETNYKCLVQKACTSLRTKIMYTSSLTFINYSCISELEQIFTMASRDTKSWYYVSAMN